MTFSGVRDAMDAPLRRLFSHPIGKIARGADLARGADDGHIRRREAPPLAPGAPLIMPGLGHQHVPEPMTVIAGAAHVFVHPARHALYIEETL